MGSGRAGVARRVRMKAEISPRRQVRRGNSRRRGLAAQLLKEGRRALADPVERARAVEGHPHDATLLRQGLENRLANPPDRVRDELDALGLIEFVSGTNEAEIALIDEIGQGDA